MSRRLLLVVSFALALLPTATPLRADPTSPLRARPATTLPAARRPDLPIAPGGRPLRGAVPTPRSAAAPAVERPLDRRVARGAPATPAALYGRPLTVDSITVEKGLRRLTLWAADLPVHTYDVALGLAPVGPKLRQGDQRTPEGLYHIDGRNPQSRYHKALHVSYPNDADRARARALGVVPGGDIMVHGLPNGQGNVGAAHRSYDWTAGCVAVTDAEMDEIFAAVPTGTPIRILP